MMMKESTWNGLQLRRSEILVEKRGINKSKSSVGAEQFHTFTIPSHRFTADGMVICWRLRIIENFFVSLSYFCLDTKVPKNQGKKNAARSTKQLSGSNKTRKRQAVLQEPLSCLSFTAPPPLLFAGPAHVLRGRESSFLIRGLAF